MHGKKHYFNWVIRYQGAYMKIKLGIIFFIFISYFAYSENIPKFYFNFGTKRTDIIFELGEPKYHLTGGHLHYETYTEARTLETLVFLVDENMELIGITIDIGLDYSPSISEKEYEEKVYNYYGEIFSDIYGEPFILNDIGVVWKFDDAFAIFQPYTKDTFLRFKFMCFPKEYAADTGYASLYE